MSGEPRARRPTLDDVAALARVSRMVASRAVRGTDNVSAAAQERVESAVRTLGYVVHQGARSLATDRTGSVAFIAPMRNQRFFSDPNVAQILSGIKTVVRNADLQVVTLIVEDDADARRVADFVLGRHVDGVMVLSPELAGDLVRTMTRAGVAVSANGLVEGAESLDSVVFDVRSRAREVAEVLRDGGARDVVVIAGPSESPETPDFVAGVSDALGPRSPDRIEHGDHSYPQGRAAMERLLKRHPDLDGVAVASDVMAMGAIAALTEQGRRVPEDVRVTGWDDSLDEGSLTPPITTLRVPYERVGRQMAGLLLERIHGSEGGRVVTTPTEVVRRWSA
jgi:DNA-binding LacI/PurR family transcriptional regulator